MPELAGTRPPEIFGRSLYTLLNVQRIKVSPIPNGHTMCKYNFGDSCIATDGHNTKIKDFQSTKWGDISRGYP